MNLAKIKYCQNCHTKFECNAANITKCQCYGIVLSEEHLANIKKQFTDCLCVQCLKKLIDESDLKGQNT